MNRNSFRLITCGALLLMFSGLALRSGNTLADQKRDAGVFEQDKGKFDILLDGKSVGHEDFEISRSAGNWIALGIADLNPPQGAQTKVTGKLTLQPDGAPVAYEWTSEADKKNGAHVVFTNGVAKITLEMQGARPFQQDFTFGSPIVAVLDNNLYHQYAVLARIYDWSKKGVQTFPVLIPQELTPGSISVEANGPVSADGRNFEGLRVTTSDAEVQLMLDANHRLMRIEVPAAKVSIVRE